MPIAYLGLGSNLGDREANIRTACALLKEKGIKILKQSSIIETDPIGGPSQGKFLNAVVKVKTQLSPHNLLAELKAIEKKLGRVKTVENGPRPIDIDILIYDNIKLTTAELTIPHPRMLKREFVMTPLRESYSKLAEQLILRRRKRRSVSTLSHSRRVDP